MEKAKKKVHPLTLTEIKSSNLHSVGYCADCQSVYVRFKDKTGALTGFYKYPKVEKSLFDEMMDEKKTVSKGSFFAAKIRALAHTRLTDYE